LLLAHASWLVAHASWLVAKLRSNFALPLGARKGLQRKAHRNCIGNSEDLQRKARFFARLRAKNVPKFRITKGFLTGPY
jgi:hypothetical protein